MEFASLCLIFQGGFSLLGLDISTNLSMYQLTLKAVTIGGYTGLYHNYILPYGYCLHKEDKGLCKDICPRA